MVVDEITELFSEFLDDQRVSNWIEVILGANLEQLMMEKCDKRQLTNVLASRLVAAQ